MKTVSKITAREGRKCKEKTTENRFWSILNPELPAISKIRDRKFRLEKRKPVPTAL
jgi:hypothetical protein